MPPSIAFRRASASSLLALLGFPTEPSRDSCPELNSVKATTGFVKNDFLVNSTGLFNGRLQSDGNLSLWRRQRDTPTDAHLVSQCEGANYSSTIDSVPRDGLPFLGEKSSSPRPTSFLGASNRSCLPRRQAEANAEGEAEYREWRKAERER